MKTKKVLVVLGTRPEAIKMASTIMALHQESNIETIVCNTRQHPQMAEEALKVFGIKSNICLGVTKTDGSLAELTSKLLSKINGGIEFCKPDIVLVHGDTQTCLAASLAAFYRQIPIGHVEGGLRTSRYESPFPEESNRRIVSGMATLHFAPTFGAYNNLLKEGIHSDKIFITGNTVVDALQYVLKMPYYPHDNTWPPGKQVILVTCHRRENWGEPVKKLCHTLSDLLKEHEDYFVAWPVHANPKLAGIVKECLGNNKQVRLYDPLNYQAFIHMLDAVDLVVTDSGGILEEVSVLKRPTLVLRNLTERPEALTLPGVKLVGNDFEFLKRSIVKWINHPPSIPENKIFGNGSAGREIVNIVKNYLEAL